MPAVQVQPWVVDADTGSFRAETTASVPVVVDFGRRGADPVDHLAGARGPRQASRGAPQGREGRCRRESRTRDQVWRAVDPVARRDPGWARGRPNCRRASSRCAGTAIAASACRLSVYPGSTFRERGATPGAELLESRVNEVGDVIARVVAHPRRLAGDQRMLMGESDSYAGAIGRPDVTPGSSPVRSRSPRRLEDVSNRQRDACFPRIPGPGAGGGMGRVAREKRE